MLVSEVRNMLRAVCGYASRLVINRYVAIESSGNDQRKESVDVWELNLGASRSLLALISMHT